MTKAHTRLGSNDLLIFLHIPKTAGTSLGALLERHFDPAEIAPFHTGALSVPETAALIRQTPRERLGQYRYMATHLDYSIHTNFPRSPVFVTLLRDPLARVVSNFRHLKHHPTRLYDIVKDMTFEEFLSSPLTRDQYHNRAACQLAGITLDEHTPLPLDESVLATAKQHLEQMPFFGLQEQFGASVHLLNYTFGWPNTYGYDVLNVSQSPTEWLSLPADTRALIMQQNELDLALYQHAERIFALRLEAMLDELMRQSEALSAVHRSQGWRLVTRLHALRATLLPDGSRRERLYRRLLGSLTRR